MLISEKNSPKIRFTIKKNNKFDDNKLKDKPNLDLIDSSKTFNILINNKNIINFNFN